MDSRKLIEESESFSEMDIIITLRFEYLKNYLVEISEWIAKKLEEDKKNTLKSLEVRDRKDSKIDIGSILLKAIMLIPSQLNEEKYTKYFNNATFLFVFSIMEAHLIQITKAAQKHSRSKLSYKDIGKPNDLEKIKIYLKNHLEIDLTDLNKLWDKIATFQKIRNRIAHNHGSIEDIDNKNDKIWFQNYFRNEKRISFDEDTESFYIIDTNYLLEFCEASKEFIVGLIAKLSERFE